MEVIISHVNLDFDGFASLLAAKKLYPEAKVVISDKQNAAVKQFLAIYRDSIDLAYDHTIEWDQVTHMILVDVASLQRVGDFAKTVDINQVRFTVYDHHPKTDDNVITDNETIEMTGAAVTLLIEEIIENKIEISSFEATVFGLGIYTDTGSFSFTNTTARDLKAASFLIENGMNLELINRFSDQMLFDSQQEIFNQLLINSHEVQIDGLNIMIATHEQKKFQGGLAILTRKLLETTGADAVIAIVEMQNRVYVVGRASSERINLLPLIYLFDGGGHEKAASATIKKGDFVQIQTVVSDHLKRIIKPAITARAMMATPVKTIAPTMTIDEAKNLMFRYGHTGLPVVEDGKLIGMISRRDIDKASHHNLGHAPVKAYMTQQVITIRPTTSLEEIQNIMIKHDIGRLPVVENGQLIGILSRTNVIEILHNQTLKEKLQSSAQVTPMNDVTEQMKAQLSEENYELLATIGRVADELRINAFMIGGIVRDILLARENDDIDIVVEGDGIDFANELATRFDGKVVTHENFRTATWEHPSGLKIDVTSSRIEYYDKPAALPHVEYSSLREDLYRRDFSINAMAIRLNESAFGELVDFFNGREDLEKKHIRILHNLSFVEDPTRILRAIRFEQRFGFTMDQETERLARTSIDKVASLSPTRISNELKAIFSEANPVEAMKRLFSLEFWQQLHIPKEEEVNILRHLDKFASTMEKLVGSCCLHKQKNYAYACTIAPFYRADDWQEKSSAFIIDRDNTNFLKECMSLKGLFLLNTIADISFGDLHEQLKKYSFEAILYTCTAESDYGDRLYTYLVARATLPELLNGGDLKALDIPVGPIYSRILLEIEKAYLNGKISSREQAIELAKTFL